MPRTRRNIRTRKSSSVSSSRSGPSIVHLYGREDPSENEPLEGTSGTSSVISAVEPQTQVKGDDSSEESDAGWSEDNDMSSELGFSLSQSSSGGNTNDEEGTITTRGYSTNRDNSGTYEQYCLDENEQDRSFGFNSDNSSSKGENSGDSSSSSDDSSSQSRTSTSGRSNSEDESSNTHSGNSEDVSDQPHDELIEENQAHDDFFSDESSNLQDISKSGDPAPKVRMFSTVDDFMERDSRKEAARRLSLNDRAVFRLIDSTEAIDCAASDPGWGHVRIKDTQVERRHSFSPKKFQHSFDDDDFEALGWLDDNSGGESGKREVFKVPRVVSADSSDNEQIDYEYGNDDDVRDHTRNYDARYDRDLSELVSNPADRSYRSDDDDEDSEDNNTYLNRSVASYISADNSSRSQPDPFLRPDVGNRPPTPPSPPKKRSPSPPKKRSPQRSDAVTDSQYEPEEEYHGLPMSPNLDFGQGESSSPSGKDQFTHESPFDQNYGHDEDYGHSGGSFGPDDFFPESLPHIDENNSVHHDHRNNGSIFSQHETSGIPFGDENHDTLDKERRRDRKLIVWLAAGLVCALLALAAVLGGVVAAAVVRNDQPQIVEATPQSSSDSPSDFGATQPAPIIPTLQPSQQPAKQPFTVAPSSLAPTPTPSKAPVSDSPTKAPVQTTLAPTIRATLAPTSRATFGFGTPPSPTPPPTGLYGFGVAKIP